MVVAMLVHAPAQTQPSATASQAGKVRILAVNVPPLADELLPEGGLVLALVSASLAKAGNGVAPQSTVRWSKEPLTQQMLESTSVDLSLPVESADCDRPNDLTQASAMLCDGAVYSEPILRVVLGLFTAANSSFKFEKDDSILGKTVCVFREHDLTALNADGRNWASFKRINVLRRASLLDCAAAVQARDADAFVAVDLEATFLLRRLGLTPYFAMQARPLTTRGVHAVVARGHDRETDLMTALNEGLKRVKESGTYAEIIQRHLTASPAPIKGAPGPAATIAGPAATITGPVAVASRRPDAPTVQPVLPPPKIAVVPLSAPVSVPTLDPASRETALKYLKRGNEELSEGRVAPARLLYERAAEMGLAQAALALGATYDATELSQPHLRNVLPDTEEAKRWYERARALGAADANARLQRLGAR
jgi:hypothetical protein